MRKTIHCIPRWFSEANDSSGGGLSAVAQFRLFSEQGTIHLDGLNYEIAKHSVFSGRWSLMGPDGEVAVAQKDSVLSRSISIQSGTGNLTLRPRSVFTRTMVLRGAGFDAVITARGMFSRGFTMNGLVPHPEIACFAFWLNAMLDRRRRRND